MAIDIGRIAFQAYKDEANTVTSNWEDLDKRHQDAWRKAAIAVLQYIDSQKSEPEID